MRDAQPEPKPVDELLGEIEDCEHDDRLLQPTDREKRLSAEVRRLREELERERVRLAGCGVAALGWVEGTDRAVPEYGDSASLQDVLRLRAERDRLAQQERTLTDENGRLAEQVETLAAERNAMSDAHAAAELRIVELRDQEAILKHELGMHAEHIPRGYIACVGDDGRCYLIHENIYRELMRAGVAKPIAYQEFVVTAVEKD